MMGQRLRALYNWSSEAPGAMTGGHASAICAETISKMREVALLVTDPKGARGEHLFARHYAAGIALRGDFFRPSPSN